MTSQNKSRNRKPLAPKDETPLTPVPPVVESVVVAPRPATVADKIRLKLGYFGTQAVYRMASVLLLLVLAIFVYLLVIFTAVSIIPNIAAFIQQGTGISIDLRLDVVIAGWLIPTFFVVGMLMIAEVMVFKAMWRFTTGIIKKMAVALFRIDEEERAVAAIKLTTTNTTH